MLERFKDGYFCQFVKRFGSRMIDKCMSKKVMYDVQEMYNQEVENVVKAEIVLDENGKLLKLIDMLKFEIECWDDDAKKLQNDIVELQTRLKVEQRRVARYVEVYGVLDVRKYNRKRYEKMKKEGEK